MSESPPRSPENPSRPATLLAGAAAIAATAWLITRVFYGLDLTDEMQYYGEIASLTRTGRFFQDDLFVQQLGYLFLLPFFKVHALLFPDQSYLVLFGRLLLLAGYGAVALLFWRTSARIGNFSAGQRLTGLAAFLAWVPFQIFSPGYNSLAYLLVVAAVAVGLTRDSGSFPRSAATLAALLAMLAVTYPPAGVVLSLIVVMEAAGRLNRRDAAIQIAMIAAAAVVTAGLMIVLHGPSFVSDLLFALKFSRAFGVAEAIFQAQQLLTWSGLTFACVGAAWWSRSRANAEGRPIGSRGLAWFAAAVVVAALAWFSAHWTVGYFSSAVFITVLALALSREAALRKSVRDLAIVGAVLGTVFAFTSGNGVHNFGLGVAGITPFLALHAARSGATVLRPFLAAFAAWLLLLNGVFHPYRELREWTDFQPVTTVPAFKGIRTSAVKHELLELFAKICPPGALQGKRVLVAGPHPAFYFYSGGQPVTPMIFMHYTGNESAYELVAQRLFQNGIPDVVLITNSTPRAIHDRIMEWAQPGCTMRTIPVELSFRRRYWELEGYDLSAEIVILTRNVPNP
jgi:hypothetical protein